MYFSPESSRRAKLQTQSAISGRSYSLDYFPQSCHGEKPQTMTTVLGHNYSLDCSPELSHGETADHDCCYHGFRSQLLSELLSRVATGRNHKLCPWFQVTAWPKVRNFCERFWHFFNQVLLPFGTKRRGKCVCTKMDV